MINFHHPFAAFLIIPVIFIAMNYLRPKSRKNILLVATKLFIIFLILLSLSSPYTVVERTGIVGSTGITIISDRTGSMRIFDDTSDEVYEYLDKETSANIDIISGNTSPIGDRIIKNLEPDGNILLISDGKNNHGRSLLDAINFARSLNATVYSLELEQVKKDMSVSIDGDSVAIVDTDSDFTININSVGDLEGTLEVTVDGNSIHSGQVTGSKQITLTHSFNDPGSHAIKAEIFSGQDDEFPENNVFYRSVQAVPKPLILLVSNEVSPLSQILGESYSVDISSGIGDISQYLSIVLDDIRASGLSEKETGILSDYVVNGGGLVVVGGTNAFTDYEDRPLFEQLLPVRTGGTPSTGKKAAVVLVIDISGSTGDLSGTDPKLGIEKGLALQIIDSMDTDDLLGVVAFNNAPHVIVPLARYPDRSGIKDTITRLRYGGTTRISPALSSAFDMVRDFDGGKNIIIISDGVVNDGDNALRTVKSMADEGVKIYSIGVGHDTNEVFMGKLASSGGYLRRDNTSGLKILFGEIDSEKRTDEFPLTIINSAHFITKNTGLNATVYGYNNVFTKQNAQTLVMTSNGNPAISTWRFGLGRVVSLGVDNGNSWAPALYNKENSKIISRIISYSVGNPLKEPLVQASDGESGKPLKVRIFSDTDPVVTLQGEKIQFDKVDEKMYETNIIPDSTGFFEISGLKIAVNERSEFRDPGNNEFMNEVIIASGGKVYNISEIEHLIPDIKSKRTGTAHEILDLGPVFLLAALLLYTIEIIVRRGLEIVR